MPRAEPATYVTDLTHFDGALEPGSNAPAPAKQPLLEFSWQGDDEGTDASGRGWAVVDQEGKLSGRIFFHRGDDSSFTATRTKKSLGRN